MWDEHEPKATISCLDFWTVGESKTSPRAQWVLLAFVQPYVFIMKEKCAVIEGEQDASVATEAPEADPESPVATAPPLVASPSKKGKKK